VVTALLITALIVLVLVLAGISAGNDAKHARRRIRNTPKPRAGGAKRMKGPGD
jgi:hypothetical protein